ncbi:pilus assembly protein [Microbulbifer epialgicus]|uniref:Pilus assembly protein n=1 Tax=Microbulbifer epialgicus TaxID=393907 RepID=A0ABV4NWV9_9GAMM
MEKHSEGFTLKTRYVKKQYFPVRPLSAALLMTMAGHLSAAPGEISDVPLYSRGSAEPNIMFVLDSSGSMTTPVYPPSEYDSDSISGFSCSSPIKPNNNKVIEFRVEVAGGSVQFRMDEEDNWRTWNNTANCFNDKKNYKARLYVSGNDGSYYVVKKDKEGNIEDNRIKVKGKFLNWYFSDKAGSVADEFLDDNGSAMRSKVDIRRTEVMKTAAKNLISELENVRIGVMQFHKNGNTGGMVVKGLESITSDNKSEFSSAIDDIGAAGNTPLAETFAGVGRYFISGYEDKHLTYQDAEGSDASAKGGDIFSGSDENNPVLDDNGLDLPDNTIANGAIQYHCQKSFMVALTDGEPTEDDSVSSTLKGYNNHDCNSDSECAADSEMDDVIKALYDIDLRPDLVNTKGEINNITSYLIGFADEKVANSQLMKHAADLGKGGKGAVYAANNAADLQLTFNQIFNEVQATNGSSSAVAFSSTILKSGSVVFTAEYESEYWTGEFSAWKIDTSGKLAASPEWKASSILDSLDPASRVMLTYDYDKAQGVPFTVAGIGTLAAHKADLTLNSYITNAVDDGRVSDRIDYLRGDRTTEDGNGGDFRPRASRLGDIVSSTPAYVGAPDNSRWSDASFPEASSYDSFKKKHTSRTPVVYVGANDGFLHGFNASIDSSAGGKEVIAYSPSSLLSTTHDEGLHPLTSQYYSHRFYVDGTPTVKDVYISDGLSKSWQTVLVGGLGAGGKGYFALNITEPDNFDEANAENIVMWEFSDKDNNNLGYTFSRPQIGRMPNGEWAAIFGNGYNSATGDAGVFIVYMDGSDDSVDNNKYVYLSTGVGKPDDLNGMSTPAIIDADLDGTIDRIYAGDLHGNMWAFDVSSKDPDSWSVEKSALFSVAPKDGDPREAITTAPVVVRNTENTTAPGLLVAFGTGQYLVETDTADTEAGGFYAVSDNGKYGLTKGDLIKREIEEKVDADSGTQLRKINGEDVDWNSKSGWYIHLKEGSLLRGEGGERVVAQPARLGEVLFFNTMIPSGQVCSAGGSGWLMSVDLWNGVATSEAVVDANRDGVIDDADKGYVGRHIVDAPPNTSGFITDEDGNVFEVNNLGNASQLAEEVKPTGGGRVGRLSWEEMTPF